MTDRAPEPNMRRGVSRLQQMMGHCSIEATLPTDAEIEQLKAVLAPTIPIYLSAPPGHASTRLADIAKRVARAGFEPIPHVAARNYADHAALRDFIARITGEAGVRRALIIAGDVDTAAGPFESASAVISTDLLQDHGIVEIGISGYPDGHPKLNGDLLRRALAEKLNAAMARGLRVHIVSQFCFDPSRILSWLRSLRAAGVTVPVRLGVAGPTSLKSLTRYALRCGVRTSFRAIVRGTASQLFGDVTPDAIVSDIAGDKDETVLGDTRFHFYSFGGIVRTAQWIKTHAALAPEAECVGEMPTI